MLLPETERVAAQVIVLPTGNAISEAQIATICGIIQAATEQADQVRAAIAAKA
jgi:dTDP-4-amino-4,6-dideoxygalactose transaminase